MKSINRRQKQNGITLVEILLAMALGLFITAGMIQIFISTRQATRVQNEAGRLQENARFAAEFLSRYIRLAGHRTDPSDDFDDVFTGSGSLIAGQVVSGSEGASGTIDSISVRYQGDEDSLITDCLGNTAAAGTITTLTFDVVGDNLRCQSQPLIEGVENIAILYGVDSNGDESADAYLNAATVPAILWDDVVSVRISLLLRSSDDEPITTEPQTYTFDGTSVTPTDLLMRRVVTTTISLRNVTP